MRKLGLMVVREEGLGLGLANYNPNPNPNPKPNPNPNPNPHPDPNQVSMAEAIMQPPLQLAAAVATVEASLWVRNGQCMSEQVLNYHSPPLCRHMSDLDLLVLQLGASQA